MTEQSTLNITNRPLLGEDDAMRLRQLLIDSYAQVGREFNWELRRWEGSFWHVDDPMPDYSKHNADTHIWKNEAGEFVGAVVLEGPRDVALQIHPDYRALEGEMLIWAEANFVSENAAGQPELLTWAFDWDGQRQALLKRRGYAPDSERFYKHRQRPASEPVPDLTVPAGYIIRGLEPVETDTVNWITCSGLVFGHSLSADYMRSFQQHAPSHRYDLHIIAEAPDGTFAAFAGLTIDEANRYAVFEPVGTHPDHRRKGLARLVMYEGVRRLQALGTVDVVYVANWANAPAGEFYDSIGFEHYATHQGWVKNF